jgi:hypothetical protein
LQGPRTRRVCTTPDLIAEVDHRVRFAGLDFLKHSLECETVAMDITKNGNTHDLTSEAVL